MSALFRLSDMQRCCNAVVVGDANFSVEAVAIDSRSVVPATLFFALLGSHQDGHAFVLDVLRRRAAAVINRRYYRRFRARLHAVVDATNSALMVVKDTRRALLSMARHYLNTFQHLTRIAITGSNGKTTTKELVAAILTEHAPTYYTPGNRNSVLGVSLSTFEVEERHRFALFEAGTDYRGEMAETAAVLRPHYTLITNIGSAHIGIFGSQSAIAREKRDLARHSPELRALFVPENEAYRALLTQGIVCPIIPYGPQSTDGFRSFRSALDGSTLLWRAQEIQSAIIGSFQLFNILGSISLSAYLGCSEREIARGITRYRPPFGRAEYIPGRVDILQDCYNANPESMRTSLDNLAEVDRKGRVVCVLGSMKELGKKSVFYHLEVVQRALQLFDSALYLFGDDFKAIKRSLEPRENARIRYHSDIEALCLDLEHYLRKGDLMLLKGSRIMRLERVTKYIQGRL